MRNPISLITNGGGSSCIEGWDGIWQEGAGLAIHGEGLGIHGGGSGG